MLIYPHCNESALILKEPFLADGIFGKHQELLSPSRRFLICWFFKRFWDLQCPSWSPKYLLFLKNLSSPRSSTTRILYQSEAFIWIRNPTNRSILFVLLKYIKPFFGPNGHHSCCGAILETVLVIPCFHGTIPRQVQKNLLNFAIIFCYCRRSFFGEVVMVDYKVMGMLAWYLMLVLGGLGGHLGMVTIPSSQMETPV